MPSSSSCASHARFLRGLVEREEAKNRQTEKTRVGENLPIDPQLQQTVIGSNVKSVLNASISPSPNDLMVEGHQIASHAQADASNHYPFPTYHASPLAPSSDKVGSEVGQREMYSIPSHAQQDHMYYENMCRELGVMEGGDLMAAPYYMYQKVNNQYAMMGH